MFINSLHHTGTCEQLYMSVHVSISEVELYKGNVSPFFKWMTPLYIVRGDIYMYLSYLLSAQNCAWPHKSRGATPHVFWQYWFLIGFVNGSTGNMSVILLLPAGRWISVQACNKLITDNDLLASYLCEHSHELIKFMFIAAEISRPNITLLYIILYRIPVHPKT